MEGFALYVSRPKTALIGAIVFASFWVVAGLFNDFYLHAPAVNSEVPGYLSWAKDFLGHSLALATFLAAGTFVFYEKQLVQMIQSNAAFLADRNKTLKRWVIICSLVCAGLAINNVYFVAFLSEDTRHWHHLLIPFILPAIIASLYYLGILLPLLMSLIRVGHAINFALNNPKKLHGFSTEDSEKCFGVSYLGNAIAVISFFLFLILLPSYGIQIYQKGVTTLGSTLVFPFAVFVWGRFAIFPGIKLASKLAKIKRTRLIEIREEIKLISSQKKISENDVRKLEILQQQDQLVLSQKIAPVSKPFAFAGFIIIAFTMFISAILWGKDLFENFGFSF